MATSYTSLLGLALPATGELSGTWGDTVNNYISTYVDSAVAGAVTVTADTTLTKTTGSSLGSTSSQYAIIIASPASANITITAPAASKSYIINNTSGTYTVKIVGAGPTTGVTLAVSEKAIVAWNGSDFVKIASSVVATGTVTSVGFTGGLITVATATTTPALTVAGTSGGIVYFSSGSTWASTAALASNALMVGGGAGAGPSTVTTATGALTFLATPTSANLAALLTDETGTGANVFATSPTLVTPILGTPTSGTLSNCTVDGTDAVGFRNIPQNSQSAAYTLVLADAGKHIFHPSTDANARTYTIPANSSVAYPIGTAITFINMTSQVVTIAITTDTMYLSSAGTTGSRSLAQYGSATAIKMTSTTWLISGSGLT
jgi:hypothetical protein